MYHYCPCITQCCEGQSCCHRRGSNFGRSICDGDGPTFPQYPHSDSRLTMLSGWRRRQRISSIVACTYWSRCCTPGKMISVRWNERSIDGRQSTCDKLDGRLEAYRGIPDRCRIGMRGRLNNVVFRIFEAPRFSRLRSAAHRMEVPGSAHPIICSPVQNLLAHRTATTEVIRRLTHYRI